MTRNRLMVSELEKMSNNYWVASKTLFCASCDEVETTIAEGLTIVHPLGDAPVSLLIDPEKKIITGFRIDGIVKLIEKSDADELFMRKIQDP